MALCWTGTVVHAALVVRRMPNEMPPVPSRAVVSTGLEGFDAELRDGQTLKLVGWVAEGSEVYGFHWDAATRDVQWGDHWSVGSGGFAYEIFSESYMQQPDSDVPDEPQALEWLVALLARLNADDMTTRSSRLLRIGGGYEALYWSLENQEFRYLEDITYFIVHCHIDAQGHVAGAPQAVDALRRYWTSDECSFLAIAEGGGPDGGHELWGMTAPGMDHLNELAYDTLVEEQSRGAMQMGAAYYAGLVVFESMSAYAPPVPFVACPWHQQDAVRGSRGRLEFRLAQEEYQHVYDEASRDHVENAANITQVQVPLPPRDGR
jgi:hypothetical protein